MITSWTISQLLRLRHAKAEAKAHAVTDKVASAQDVAAMFRTSLALRLLCLANAWAEETILYRWFQQLCAATAVSLSALRVDGAPLNVLLAANAVWAHHASLSCQGGCAQQRRDNERCLGLVLGLKLRVYAQFKLQIKSKFLR